MTGALISKQLTGRSAQSGINSRRSDGSIDPGLNEILVVLEKTR
jgi:hypothetical protein